MPFGGNPSIVHIHEVEFLPVKQSKTFTVDALLKATQTKTLAADAILKKTLTKLFSIDALLKATKSKTLSINAILKATFSKSFKIDALLQATQKKTLTLDAILRETQAKTFTVNALLKNFSILKYFSIDAILKLQNIVKQFTADAILIAPTPPGPTVGRIGYAPTWKTPPIQVFETPEIIPREVRFYVKLKIFEKVVSKFQLLFSIKSKNKVTFGASKTLSIFKKSEIFSSLAITVIERHECFLPLILRATRHEEIPFTTKFKIRDIPDYKGLILGKKTDHSKLNMVFDD